MKPAGPGYSGLPQVANAFDSPNGTARPVPRSALHVHGHVHAGPSALPTTPGPHTHLRAPARSATATAPRRA